ncbi:retrovirus-related Pol polyprotein from transposon 412 [Trichonephila clavipes]|nr:retrovirus-related Pol polyprotein from transposon 412 [Trichonephila clavipes]
MAARQEAISASRKLCFPSSGSDSAGGGSEEAERGTVSCKSWRVPVSAREGAKDAWRSRGSCIAAMLERPSRTLSLSISLGPLPKKDCVTVISAYLFVMDYFTKWPEVYPIPDQEAPTVAEAVVRHWISNVEVPLQLHSDQGRNFVSAVLKGLWTTLRIRQRPRPHLAPTVEWHGGGFQSHHPE